MLKVLKLKPEEIGEEVQPRSRPRWSGLRKYEVKFGPKVWQTDLFNLVQTSPSQVLSPDYAQGSSSIDRRQ